MINRATGEVDIQTGLHIRPHASVQSLFTDPAGLSKIKTRKLSLQGWTRHTLGCHTSEHGTFEVEALSAEEQRVYVVLLSHNHPFYEPRTPDDAERRTFHEGVIATDLAGQKEFTWGQAFCRFEPSLNQDWLVIAYSREARKPLPERDILRHLYAHENLPEDDT